MMHVASHTPGRVLPDEQFRCPSIARHRKIMHLSAVRARDSDRMAADGARLA